MLEILYSDFRNFSYALLPLPEFSPELFISTDKCPTSSSTCVFEHVIKFGDIPTENAITLKEHNSAQNHARVYQVKI